MTFIHNSSVFSNSKSIHEFREVHEVYICFCRYLNMESSAAPGYTWAAHLWRPKSPATTKLMLFCKTLRCLWLLFCRNDGFRAFFLHLHYIILLMDCVIILCSCGTENCSRVTAVITWICQLFSVNMIWNNSVELDDVRTLHWLQSKKSADDARRTNLQTCWTYKRSLRTFGNRSRMIFFRTHLNFHYPTM